MDKLDPQHTALVLIDLQKGIAPFAAGPHTASEVNERAGRLAARFRELGAPVVLVRVGFSADGRDMLRPLADQVPPSRALPADWLEYAEELSVSEGDIHILKRQWGAFYGTELELQLRRRGVSQIVLGGIATNIGVESTARHAFELGFQQVFVEDAMSSGHAEHHRFAVENIFPRLGRVRSTEQVLAALA
ncbi:hydrolase [Dyella sp. ASV21]|jgi:nicotinamidase-related amidase|uniref:hydrolase n=1 Tax=Dyella sp. ASV21 TaxID=2795114 RepID=UPI0018ECD895|nr:hydrolase [Dyella sp. ASV21]